MKVNHLCTILTAVCLLTAPSSPVWADFMVTLTPDADTYLRDATPRGGLGFMDVRGGNVDFRSYLRFAIPAPPLGDGIVSATLTLHQVPGASRNDTIVGGRFALYGLGPEIPGIFTPQNWDEATLVPDTKGTEDVTTLSGVVDLDDNVAGITETIAGSAPDGMVSVTGSPLVEFLSSRISGPVSLVTFILSNDDGTDRGFGFGTKENVDPTKVPTLTIVYTPEPASLALMGLAVAGLGLARRR